MNRVLAANQNASRRYTADAVDDELNVVHDDVLYRHLLNNEDGSSFYGFAVITWPRPLVITGDRGSYAFFRKQ